MPRDNRRIGYPENCISPHLYKEKLPTESYDESWKKENHLKALRPMALKLRFIPTVSGSAYFECGNTKILCSVNGPKDISSKSESSIVGQLCCEFKYAIFSCVEKQPHMPTTKEHRMSKFIQDSLQPVVLLHKYPKARIDIAIYVLEDDGGVATASITCAGVALSIAGIEMYGLPVGCSLIMGESFLLVDPTAEEENIEKDGENIGRLSLGMMPAYNSQMIFMEQSGNFSSESFIKGLKELQNTCHLILEEVNFHLKSYLQATEKESTEIFKTAINGEMKLFKPHKYLQTFLELKIRTDKRGLLQFRPILVNLGSIGNADGSAIVRLNDTSVICGVKAQLTNPTNDEPDKGFFVPNVTMSQLCSSQFAPGPPKEQAQVYSQAIMDLWKDTHFVLPEDLCIQNSKLSWCLFVEMICLSHSGNVLDACILAMMTALKHTRLPEVIMEDDSFKVTDKRSPLKMNSPVLSMTYANFNNVVVADPTSEEEALADGVLTIFRHENDSKFKLQSFGRFEEEQIFECIDHSKSQVSILKSFIK